MADIRFYHLERSHADQALPQLLAKALGTGTRIVLKTVSPAERDRLNAHLWTYDPASFLPHGTEEDGDPDQQPIWITAGDDRPNGAPTLFLLGGAPAPQAWDNWGLCCVIFNGKNQEELDAARSLWASLKGQDHTLTYWKQGDKGWEKAA
jgi:DNA polymerase III subunit chi